MADPKAPEKKFEIIDTITNVTEDKKSAFRKYEVAVNLMLQKNVYEDLYNRLAKEVDIQGFRKGMAPRDMVEPKVYPQASEQIQRILLEAILQELPRYIKEKMDEVLLDVMEVEKISFTLVDVPLKATLRAVTIKPKLGNISKIKLDLKRLEKIEVTEEEVDKAMKETWEGWRQHEAEHHKEENKLEKYPEITDTWIKEELKIKDVSTLQELKAYLKTKLTQRKKEITKEELLKELLNKAVETSKIDIPQEYVEELSTKEQDSFEKQVKNYGITLEQYLKSQNKTVEDFQKELKNSIRERISHDVLFQIYRNAHELKIDKNNEADKKYVDVAQQYVEPPKVTKDQPQPSQEELLIYAQRVIGAALNIKTQVHMAKEVGLNLEEDQEAATKAA